MAQLNLNVTFVSSDGFHFSHVKMASVRHVSKHNNLIKILSVSMNEETPHDRRPAIVPEVTLTLSYDRPVSTGNVNILCSE
jgi:hypothetical protein